MAMRPLADWPAAERSQIFGVFTDIDDTLTEEGTVSAPTVQALADLKAAGLHVIPITGRPVGWSVPFAQSWPVDAIVAENGSVALTRTLPPPSGEGGGGGAPAPAIQKVYQQDAATRAAHFARMQQVAQRLLRELPGTSLARDSAGRETDIAIDHSEFGQLPQPAIDAVVRIMQAEGMSATVSSIHINGWYGAHNKLEGARWIVRQLYGRDLEAELGRWAYVGDSTNDQLMFQHFAHSVGVANIRRFEAQLEYRPRWITPSERGAGFCEFARALLAARA